MDEEVGLELDRRRSETCKGSSKAKVKGKR